MPLRKFLFVVRRSESSYTWSALWPSGILRFHSDRLFGSYAAAERDAKDFSGMIAN